MLSKKGVAVGAQATDPGSSHGHLKTCRRDVRPGPNLDARAQARQFTFWRCGVQMQQKNIAPSSFSKDDTKEFRQRVHFRLRCLSVMQ